MGLTQYIYCNNQLVNVSMQKIPEEVSNSYSLRLNTDPIKLLEFLDISYEKITLLSILYSSRLYKGGNMQATDKVCGNSSNYIWE